MKERLVVIKENKMTVAIIAAVTGALIALISIIAYKKSKGDEMVEDSDCASVQ